MTNLDSTLKSQRHYFANKGPSSQGYGFSSGHVWMWALDCEGSWAPNIDAFEMWCWRRLLRIPWTARIFNQSILKEIRPGCSLEGLMAKLKLQYFGHLMRRVDSLEKTLMLEGLGARWEGDDRGWDGWMASPTLWTCVWVNSGSWWWTGRPGVLQFMGLQGVRHDWVTELNWTIIAVSLLPELSARNSVSYGLWWCRWWEEDFTLCLLQNIFSLLGSKRLSDWTELNWGENSSLITKCQKISHVIH